MIKVQVCLFLHCFLLGKVFCSMRNNVANFYFVSLFNLFALLYVELLRLKADKADSFEVLEGVSILLVLNKTDHCLIAFHIEFVLHTRINRCKLLSVSKWILANFRLDVISEVCDEAHSIIKLNNHSLSIDRSPCSFNLFIRSI